ncbi:MAG: hypothetical protein HOB79_05555 [Rhodospirillaceae bacterium]|nr:hypothetical protein [Rhodospirillaceae bacterium]MBT7488516.1 hypothetical protein [Rhodospirillales bacterium]MBT4700522.1 hypothetical protein [Rhodospirillaceae bacterium]MBT5033555.1 hypothetical protein [Rhodospirillaceae bacterium]MBT6219432.1 hypothetical protein [Rhodospirillaceae bacterium]
MAIEFNAVAAQSIALDNRAALEFVRPTTSTSKIANVAFNLTDSLSPGRFVTQSIRLDINDARRGLSQAILAGTSIQKALEQLTQLADLATKGGVVASDTNLTVDGTRVSGLNIETQINRAIGLINRLVATANVKGANFISSSSLQIKIPTTRFGGSITVTPQPLNSSALGIDGLKFTTVEEARLGEARLRRAGVIAGARVLALQQLQVGLGQSSSFNQALVQFISSSSSGAVPTGSLVNLSA